MGYKQVNLDRPLDSDLSSATQINLGNKLGVSVFDRLIEFNNGGYTNGTMVDTKFPMFATIEFVPTIGDTKQGTESGFTDAINTYYVMLRSKNSSISAFSPIDVFKLSLAITQINVLADDIKRTIRSTFLNGEYFSINFKRGINRALTKDAPDLKALEEDIATYITDFNQIVKSAKQIVFPKYFQVNNRFHKLMNCIYAEDPEMIKSQMIIFKPIGIWKLVLDATDPMVGQFKFEVIKGLTVRQKIDLLKSLVNMIGNDSDYNNIMAEIKKAVEGNCYRIEPLPVTPEPVDINYSLDVVDLVRNATYVGDLADVSDQYLYENTTKDYPYLTHYNANANYSSDPEHLYVGYSYNFSSSDPVTYKNFDTRSTSKAIHSHADAPDNKTAYNITAGFSNIYSYPANPNPRLKDFATEVYTHFIIWQYDSNSQAWTSYSFQSFYKGLLGVVDVRNLHSFSCAPDVICYGYNSGDLYNSVWIHSDIDNVSFVPAQTIAKAQSVALQSALVFDNGSGRDSSNNE